MASSSAAENPLAKRRKTGKYREATDITDTVLFVEGEKLHVVKEILMVASPVFKAMFNGKFKEGNTLQVTLTGKKPEEVEWMLDYLYPEERFRMTDGRAAKLVLLANEYQLKNLKEDCVEVLMKQEQPRLEIVTVAQLCNLPDLLQTAIQKCASTLPYTTRSVHLDLKASIDEQLKLPVNAALSKDNLINIYREKLWLLTRGVYKVKHDWV